MGSRFPSDNPFLAAMADAPGDGTPLLVYADWLDEQNRPGLAAAVREMAPRLVARYRRASECLDAFLAVDVGRARPFPMPTPDRGANRSRRQWRDVVRAALKPFRLPHVTVAVAPGWRPGPDVEVRVPSADYGIGDASGDVLLPPWKPGTAEMVAGGTLVLAELMPLLFPGEPGRQIDFDGETFETSFWRVEARLQP